jgi:hypothetical protein
MAMAAFNGGQAWYPSSPMAAVHSADTTNFQINASGEIVAMVARMPRAGTIDKMAAIVHAVANAPDNGLRFSLQGVSASTGLNDGTILESTNAFATVASGSVTTGWLESGAFAASHTVTRNELLALVVDFPSFVAADDVIVRGLNPAAGTASHQLPYAIHVTNTINATRLPLIFAHYTDDGGFWQSLSEDLIPLDATVSSVSYDTGTTPDEIGVVFIPSQPCRLNRARIWMMPAATGGNFDVIVYDSGGGVLDTVSYDGDQVSTVGSMRFLEHWLSAGLELTAGSTYRIAVKPTTTNNVQQQYYLIGAGAAGASAFPGRFVNYFYTTRTDAGAWTNYNNGSDGYRWPAGFYLGFDAFDDAAGGAGGNANIFSGSVIR